MLQYQGLTHVIVAELIRTSLERFPTDHPFWAGSEPDLSNMVDAVMGTKVSKYNKLFPVLADKIYQVVTDTIRTEMIDPHVSFLGDAVNVNNYLSPILNGESLFGDQKPAAHPSKSKTTRDNNDDADDDNDNNNNKMTMMTQTHLETQDLSLHRQACRIHPTTLIAKVRMKTVRHRWPMLNKHQPMSPQRWTRNRPLRKQAMYSLLHKNKTLLKHPSKALSSL